MTLTETDFEGLVIIEPRVFEDDRGYFMESYNQSAFHSLGLNNLWIQDNQSRSTRGVLRGLHYQLNPSAQAKLIRVIEGEIYDVALDLRRNSKTFGKWFGIHISSDNKKQFLVPAGFAHGFSVVSEKATVLYKCDILYSPNNERGINPLDPELGIDWKIKTEEIILSEKDKISPLFKKAEYNFND
jgi:dTDP-4-dehydrorhamnose 3,5-epimerase